MENLKNNIKRLNPNQGADLNDILELKWEIYSIKLILYSYRPEEELGLIKYLDEMLLIIDEIEKDVFSFYNLEFYDVIKERSLHNPVFGIKNKITSKDWTDTMLDTDKIMWISEELIFLSKNLKGFVDMCLFENEVNTPRHNWIDLYYISLELLVQLKRLDVKTVEYNENENIIEIHKRDEIHSKKFIPLWVSEMIHNNLIEDNNE